MEAKAYLRNCRIAPRKVQIVLDLIRGQDLKKAQAILKYTSKSACEPVLKLVNSAAANAENNFQMNKDSLYVAECFVCQGLVYNAEGSNGIERIAQNVGLDLGHHDLDALGCHKITLVLTDKLQMQPDVKTHFRSRWQLSERPPAGAPFPRSYPGRRIRL